MITANAVTLLRQQTSCGIMDCKQALLDANGDFDAAKNLLRQRLGALDTDKTDSGTEGIIAIHTDNAPDFTSCSYAILELATETDFTARNPEVQKAANDILEAMLNTKEYDSIINRLRATTGENIFIRRADSGQVDDAPNLKVDVAYYVHHDNRSGAYVIFSDSSGIVASDHIMLVHDIMRSIAMHIVAVTPSAECVHPADVPEDLIEKEKAFLQEKARQTGKPQNIQDKIIDGGIAKFRDSRALLEQPFVRDPNKKVKHLLPQGVSIVEFDRWQIGQNSN